MIEVIVFAEGPTEEQFIKRTIAPALRHLEVYVKAQTLRTSQTASGGAVNFDRLKFNARNTLRANPKAVLTTFLDLYGLDTSFPSFVEAKEKLHLNARLQTLESALHSAMVEHIGCQSERFIPHIQPHEFEGLLFSDTEALVQIEPGWLAATGELNATRDKFQSPEHINDNYETKPSRVLETLLQPGYKKTRHGPLAADRIGLRRIEQECGHFREWMDKLRALCNVYS
jgi:hypothetical protein